MRLMQIIKIKYLTNKPFGGWFWYPMSSAMFRKKSVDLILSYKNTDDWKICPDKFIFNLVNLLEGSALIDTKLFFKRQHENNAGNFNRTKLNIENLIQNEVERISTKYDKDFLDCEDLIKITGLGRDNVRNLLRSKNFPTTKVGKRQVVSVLNFVTWQTMQNKNLEVNNG